MDARILEFWERSIAWYGEVLFLGETVGGVKKRPVLLRNCGIAPLKRFIIACSEDGLKRSISSHEGAYILKLMERTLAPSTNNESKNVLVDLGPPQSQT